MEEAVRQALNFFLSLVFCTNVFLKTYLSFVKQNISNFASSEAAPIKSSSFQDTALYPVKSNSYQFY